MEGQRTSYCPIDLNFQAEKAQIIKFVKKHNSSLFILFVYKNLANTFGHTNEFYLKILNTASEIPGKRANRIYPYHRMQKDFHVKSIQRVNVQATGYGVKLISQ